MAKVIWQAKVPDGDYKLMEVNDLDELCEKLNDFWDELLESKMMKIIDRATQMEP